jgi:hypothetical protein
MRKADGDRSWCLILTGIAAGHGWCKSARRGAHALLEYVKECGRIGARDRPLWRNYSGALLVWRWLRNGRDNMLVPCVYKVTDDCADWHVTAACFCPDGVEMLRR